MSSWIEYCICVFFTALTAPAKLICIEKFNWTEWQWKRKMSRATPLGKWWVCENQVSDVALQVWVEWYKWKVVDFRKYSIWKCFSTLIAEVKRCQDDGGYWLRLYLLLAL